MLIENISKLVQVEKAPLKSLRKGSEMSDLQVIEGAYLYIQDDNTHLRPEAYPRWAEAIQPVINKYGLCSIQT